MQKLSIVIPVYNVEKYISKCLDSVIDERYETEYEIIVVNDGSPDRSPEIVQSYISRYPALIRMISTENFGLGHARNVGIENARAEYIFFIDSDDYLPENAVAEFLDMIKSGDDMYIFDASFVRDDESEIKYVRGCAREENISLETYPELLLELPNVWNKIYRRSLFSDNAVRFPDRAWFEDLRTVLKLYAFTDKIEYVPKCLYKYVQHANTITRSKKPDRNVEMIDAVDDLLSFFQSVGKYDALADVLEYLSFHSQFLTSSVRANLACWNTPVQDALIDDFLKKFPDFRRNPYIMNISKAHKLLLRLFLKKRYLAVHLLMRANSVIKGTNF